MSKVLGFAKRFVADECGAEVTELGVMLALIVAASVPIMALIGPKVLAAYTAVNGAIP